MFTLMSIEKAKYPKLIFLMFTLVSIEKAKYIKLISLDFYTNVY